MINISRPRAAALALAAAALTGALTACGTTGDEAGASAEQAWPRTIEHGGQSTTITAEPQHIVAASSESADLLLGLVGPQRMAAVAAGSTAEGTGTQVELARQVPTTLPSGTNPDPEQLLSLQPDLVVLTARHAGEQNAAAALEASHVPTLVLGDDDFVSLDALRATITVLGKATGTESLAEQQVATLSEREHAALATLPANPPTVLTLMARGPMVMIQPKDSMLTSLVRSTGAKVLNDDAGNGAPAADPELIARLAPQVILLEDFMGRGAGPFQALLRNPALASVPAIANGRVETISSTQASATSGLATADGLESLVTLLGRTPA